MVERKDPAFTNAPIHVHAPTLRPALLTPRRDSSRLVPVVILGGMMSMTLLGAIAWFQMKQRACPDAMPIPQRSVTITLPAEPAPSIEQRQPMPYYGQRDLWRMDYPEFREYHLRGGDISEDEILARFEAARARWDAEEREGEEERQRERAEHEAAQQAERHAVALRVQAEAEAEVQRELAEVQRADREAEARRAEAHLREDLESAKRFQRIQRAQGNARAGDPGIVIKDPFGRPAAR